MSQGQNPRRQVPLEIVHPTRKLRQVAFVVQTATPKTGNGNLNLLAIVDAFWRYVRAKAIPDERSNTIFQTHIEELLSISGLMESLLSNEGPSLVGDVTKNLKDMLQIGRMQSYAFHPRPTERWKDETER